MLHSDQDKKNPKNQKHWKLKCEKYTGFKAQMENKETIKDQLPNVKLVSWELIHFGVIARLFRQIGGHSCRFVLFCSF